MGKYNFLPWVGSKYFTEGFHGKRILVLGESHHCEDLSIDNCHSFTQQIIIDYICKYNGEPAFQTFLCFERAVIGKELSYCERGDFWNRIMFYNYVQSVLPEPRKSPTPEQWKVSTDPYRTLLEEYMPDYIIVWGSRLYNKLPEFDGKHSFLCIDETNKTDVWTYNIKGKIIPAMRVCHPSAPRGKNWQYWHKFYVKFLGL